MDFNLENYSIIELKNMFNLNKDEPTKILCVNQYNNLKDKLVNNCPDQILKANILDFLKKGIIKVGFEHDIILNGDDLLDTSNLLNSYLSPLSENKVGINNIIIPKKKEIESIKIVEHAAGELNPLKRQTFTKILNIDTRFRGNLNVINTDLKISLEQSIKNVVSVGMFSIEFPNSSYTFSDYKKSNVFTINTKYNNAEGYLVKKDHIVKISEGNYNSESLEEYLNKYFNVDTLPDDRKELGFINMSVNIQTAKTSFYTDSVKYTPAQHNNYKNFTFDLDFTIPKLESTDGENNRDIIYNFGYLLGFLNKEYLYKNDYNTDTTSKILDLGYNSESVYNGGGHKYMYLYVNDYKNNQSELFIDAFNNKRNSAVSSVTKNILARIPIITSKFNYDFVEHGEESIKREYFGPVNIERLDIKLLDEFGEILDLNNLDYSLALEFECLYNL